MRIGTKSVLYGAHQFLLHPWFVAWAWWHLYGFPLDPRLWIAFFVHDLGYWGKPNMDGEEGETHVELGARVMGLLFDWPRRGPKTSMPQLGLEKPDFQRRIGWWKYEGWFFKNNKWYDFCLYHSRFYAKRDGAHFSKLCVADKLSFALTPRWLYLLLVRATGEIHEYMVLAKTRTDLGEPKYASMNVSTDNQAQWYEDVKLYMIKWVEEHKDMRPDSWTPSSTRTAASDTGVYR